MNKIKLSEFFNNDYVDQASYDNLRKIASVIDGQKNTSRKILHTILMKNITDEIKVSQLNSKVAEYTEYLHGDMSGVIVNLAQDFIGTNNIPLLQKSGNFGTRFSNSASAPRYIYTYGSKSFFNLFKKDDIQILKHQFFEGSQIEPMFFVPSLPILLINGSEGVSSGFAQKILPRNPDKIKQYIKDTLFGKLKPNKNNSLEPYYNGFKGSIESGENINQWKIKGVLERKSINKILITELPIGYDLKGYLSVLDNLEEKKIIQNYKDKSENNIFEFEVTIPSQTLKNLSDNQLYEKLKLIKTITENYTCIDENNKIIIFNCIKDLIDHYILVKLEYLTKRKEYLESKLKQDIRYDFSKYLFIKMIVDNKLKINKRKKDNIIIDLDKIDKIIKKDDSYDYLLNMNILSLTKERMEKLEDDIRLKKLELDSLIKTTIEQLWGDEL